MASKTFSSSAGNKLLVGYKFSFGYLEVDLESHKVVADVRDFLTREQAILTSVKRLENGPTLIMAQSLPGGGGTWCGRGTTALCGHKSWRLCSS